MKKFVLLAFIVMAVAQWTVPLTMLWSRTTVLKKGTKIKLRTGPVDPADIFKGRYIYLSFPGENISLKTVKEYENGQEVFATFDTISNGYSKINTISSRPPANSQVYLKVKVVYASKGPAGRTSLKVDYPFDQYYMEESKAPKAERIYRDSAAFADKTYALVSIYRGESVLEGVYVNGIRIEELLPK